MKTVTVNFMNSTRTGYCESSYDYLVEDDADVSVGDNAVVHNGIDYAIVRVVDVNSGVSSKANKTLVMILNQKVRDEYEAMNVKAKEHKALFARLEQILAQESENNKYRLLAASNSEAAEILKKLGIK